MTDKRNCVLVTKPSGLAKQLCNATAALSVIKWDKKETWTLFSGTIARHALQTRGRPSLLLFIVSYEFYLPDYTAEFGSSNTEFLSGSTAV
jgi:hypothetical protein